MFRGLTEPAMSDKTLLMSVEDLINIALGPAEKNIVNFKLLQTILHILARQMRLLEQLVEIRLDDLEDFETEREADERRRRGDGRREKSPKGKDKGSKDRDKAEKDSDKDKKKRDRGGSVDRGTDKDRDKDRGSSKDRKGGKADKGSAKDEKGGSREREKDEKGGKGGKGGTGRDRDEEEAERGATDKGAKGSVKGSAKGEKGEKEKDKGDRGKSTDKTEKERDKKGRTASDTSIVISEVDRKKDKVLVVEKGPSARETRRDGIEVVTRSQFELVSNIVRGLQRVAGPPPAPMLPDNEKLRSDLVRGNASLTDTMQAMQVTARVLAAEKAITRMGELLTKVAAAGGLPGDLAAQLQSVRYEPPNLDALAAKGSAGAAGGAAGGGKSVGIQEGAGGQEGGGAWAAGGGSAGRASRASMASKASMGSSYGGGAGVTHPEMNMALGQLRDDLLKQVQTMTMKASGAAENVTISTKGIADKMNIALGLDAKIKNMNQLISDYAEQLSGFDSSVTTQIHSFSDQMAQMRAELKSGLAQLEQVNNNAETTAVAELRERYEWLCSELDHAVTDHNALLASQHRLSDDLHSLVECVEMLREQKADRDEVQDGLRDKADNTRLAGLLTVAEFGVARAELEQRIDMCHDKFLRQESVWMTALKDLGQLSENKAEMVQLMSARERAEQALRELQAMQEKLAVILGEPKAALLTRALAAGAACGACQAPALMEPQDGSFGAPPPLPPLPARRAPPPPPCEPAWKPPVPPDHREHTCNRWVGGSHTLLGAGAATRAQAPPPPPAAPTRQYTGYGSDGRLYMMEEELVPCKECNQYSDEIPQERAPEEGAGDQRKP